VTWSLAELKRRFRDRRHTALLAATVAAFAVRPLVGDGGAAPIVFSGALLLLLLIALYNIRVDELVGERSVLLGERRRQSAIAWTLALLALAERVLILRVPSPRLVLVSSISWLTFLLVVTWIELRSVLRQKEVTGETISMCVSVYLLMGLCWGLLYAILFQVDLQSFNLGGLPAPDGAVATTQHLIPIFIYFSLTTLSTIGFGDITPLTLQARYAAVAEGITGQFYLAVLVARLVGMQMSQPAKPDADRSS
jgi:Ion channel